jgi:sugar phosphate isomerase/epimerase
MSEAWGVVIYISILLALIATWKGAKVLLESDRAASPKTARFVAEFRRIASVRWVMLGLWGHVSNAINSSKTETWLSLRHKLNLTYKFEV